VRFQRQCEYAVTEYSLHVRDIRRGSEGQDVVTVGCLHPTVTCHCCGSPDASYPRESRYPYSIRRDLHPFCGECTDAGCTGA